MMRLKYILLCLFLLSLTGLLKAQNLEYGVRLDTTYMLIGDQQKLRFQVKSIPGLNIRFPQLKDTVVRGVEIISGPVQDSVKQKDGSWLYESTYVITAFDTGVYVIPPMPITVEGEEYNSTLRTDPVGFAVNTYEVDPQKGNYDIVMPYAAPWTFAEILPYLLWGLLAIALIVLVWLYIARLRKNKPLFTPKKEEIPPYVMAIRSLDEIKEKKLWQAGKEKEYYTRLTDTVRMYLDGEFGIPAMEQTSGETIRELGDCNKVDTRERERLAEMLTTADFVKFARFTPLQDENSRYLETAYDFVNTTHERVQAELEEQQKEEEKKKEAQRMEEKEKGQEKEREEKMVDGTQIK